MACQEEPQRFEEGYMRDYAENSRAMGKANVPTIDPCHILKKVRKLHEENSALKKSKSRESVKAVENRMYFQVNKKNLFDIAHQDAMQLMTIKEDRDFLKAQRETRRKVKMSGVDEDWVLKRKRKQKMKETERFEREKKSQGQN